MNTQPPWRGDKNVALFFHQTFSLMLDCVRFPVKFPKRVGDPAGEHEVFPIQSLWQLGLPTPLSSLSLRGINLTT